MSENLNRSTPDFSKYDSMSIGELEEILRADAMGPERDDSDVDEILYVMEVLAKKRRQNGIAGKTALEAYQEFQQHYLPEVEEESKPRRKINVILFRKIAAVAASLILVLSLTTTANAFSFKDVWDAVVTWAQETFCFSVGVEVSAPKTDSELEYASLQEALHESKRNSDFIPSVIPENFELVDLRLEYDPIQEKFTAMYLCGERMLKIAVQSYLMGSPEQIELSDDLIEVYTAEGVDYYFFSNHKQNRVAWITDSYECYISGDVSLDELKSMVYSIEKGH